MTTFKSWDDTKEYELLPCPFCGGAPEAKHIGNDYKRKKLIEIRCKSCGAKRTDAALRHGFEWLENVAVTGWNQRKFT